MAGLREQVESTLREAIRERDEVAKNALRGLLTAIKTKEKELKRMPVDAEIIQLISSQIKQRREAIEQFAAGGRGDLVESETREIAVLERFVPTQLSPEELDRLVAACIEEAGAVTSRDIGKVMKLIMAKVAGRADGKLVNEMVKARLGRS